MPRKNEPPTQVYPDPEGAALPSSMAQALESIDAPVSASPARDEQADSESDNFSMEGR